MLMRCFCACFLAVAMVFCSPLAFAGKVELTTYYPAPYGDYKELKATGADTENSKIALQASGSDTTAPGLAVTNANNVGIGTKTPEAKLEVAGQVKITGGNPGANKVLTSDANGLASWSGTGQIVGTGSCKDGFNAEWDDVEEVSGAATCEHPSVFYYDAAAGLTPVLDANHINSVVCPAGSVKMSIFKHSKQVYLTYAVGGEGAICVSSGAAT